MQATQHRETKPVIADLLIQEAVSVTSAGPVREDGLVPVHIIRPGVGRGRGRHLYTREMLQEAVSQGRFASWKMYVDHQSPEAKKKAQGLPRSMKDLGGIVKEAWWDDNVPANPEMGWERGAVVGLAKPTRFMRALIEDIPEAIGTSISAQATAIRHVSHNGEHVGLVEGIRPKGSVDWVTEAGAGGRVVSLMESLEESAADGSDDIEEEVLGAMDDVELREYLQEHRPELLDSLQESVAPEGESEREGEHAGPGEQPNDKKETEMTLKEMLQEALQDDEAKTLLAELLAPLVETEFVKVVAPKLTELVEAAMEDERELNIAEAKAVADRRIEVRDLKDHAHGLIEASRLPETFKRELRAKYDLSEGGEPSASLDVVKTDEKTSKAILAEAVEADIDAKREQHREISPTAVRGQGTTTKPEGTQAAVEEAAKKTSGSVLTDAILVESEIPADEIAGLWTDL